MKSFALALLLQLASAAIIVNPTTVLPTTTTTTTTTSSTPTPTQPQITILSVSYSGSGCPSTPNNTVTTTLASNNTITFGFDDFQVFIGPNFTLADSSKNCQLHLNLQYPPGIQYAVASNVYHGFAQLDAAVTGHFFSDYYYSQDASATVSTEATIAGGGALAQGTTYTKQDVITTGAQIFSSCGGTSTFNINNRISLTSTSSTAKGELTDDDLTVRMTQQVNLVARPCTA